MAVIIADLVAKFSGDTSGFDQSVSHVNQQINGLSSGDVAKGVAGGLVGTAAFGAVTDAAKGAITTAADFQSQISGIMAVGGREAVQNADGIRQTALDLGRDTSFSASEAAAGMEELIKAGVPVADVLSGAAAAALDLSAATGVSVPEAATLMATGLNVFGDGMTGFNTEGEKAVHIADLLAQTANASAADVHDLGLGFSQAANVADSFGISVDETAQALGIMSNAGLRGSDAGTSLKTMLLSLLDPTKEQTEQMGDLGLAYSDFYGADGHFIGLANASQLLQDHMAGLSDAEKQNALAVLFGSDAYRAAKILTEAGVQGFEDFAGAQEAAGTATEQAQVRLGNFNGAMEQLRGSLETFAIGVASNLLGPLTDLAGIATDAVNALVGLPAPVQAGIAVFAGLAVAIAAVAAGAMLLGPLLAAIASPLALVGIAGAALAGLGVAAYQTNFMGFADAVNGARDAVDQFVQRFQFFMGIAARESGFDGLARQIEAFGVAFDTVTGNVADLSRLTDALAQFADNLSRAASWWQVLSGIDSPDFASGLAEGLHDLGTMVRMLTGLDAQGWFDRLAGAVDSATGPMESVKASLADVARGAVSFGQAVVGGDFGQALDLLREGLGNLGDLIGGAAASLADWTLNVGLPSLVNWVGGDLGPKIGDALAGVGAAVAAFADWALNVALPAVANWVGGDLAPLLGSAVKSAYAVLTSFADWTLNVGLPAVANWVGGTLAPTIGAAVGAVQGAAVAFGNWVLNVGLPTAATFLGNLADLVRQALGIGGGNSLGGPGERGEAGSGFSVDFSDWQLHVVTPAGGITVDASILGNVLDAVVAAWQSPSDLDQASWSAKAKELGTKAGEVVLNAIMSGIKAAFSGGGGGGGGGGVGLSGTPNDLYGSGAMPDSATLGSVALEIVGDFVSGFVDAFNNAAIAKHDEVVAGIQEGMQSIQQAIFDALNSVGSAILGGGGNSMGGPGERGEAGTGVFESLFAGLTSALRAGFDALGKIDFGAMVTALVNGVKAAFANIDWGDLPKQIWDSLIAAIKAAMPKSIDIDQPPINMPGLLPPDPSKQVPAAMSPDVLSEQAAAWLGTDPGQGKAAAAAGRFFGPGQQIVTSIADGIAQADLSPIQTAMSGLMAKIQAMLASGAGGGNSMGGPGERGEAGTGGMSSAGTQMVAQMAAGITAGAGQVTAAVQALTTSVGTTLSTATNTWVTTMATTMGALSSAVTSGMATVQSAVGTGIQTATTTISVTTNQWVTTMATTMGAMASAVTSGMGRVADAVREGAEAAVTALRDAAGQAEAAGINFGMGFANGIDGTLGAAAGAAARLAKSALDALKGAIVEGSPSRLTEESGKNFGEGFRLGIEQTGAGVGQAAQGIAQQAIAALGLPDAQSAMQSVVASLGQAADAVKQTADQMGSLGQATAGLADATKSLYGGPDKGSLQNAVFGNLAPAVQGYFGSWGAIQKLIDDSQKQATLPARRAAAEPGAAPAGPQQVNATIQIDGGSLQKFILGTAVIPLTKAAEQVGNRGRLAGA